MAPVPAVPDLKLPRHAACLSQVKSVGWPGPDRDGGRRGLIEVNPAAAPGCTMPGAADMVMKDAAAKIGVFPYPDCPR